MNPASFCGRAFPKHTYFRRKEAHDGLDLSSLLHARSAGPTHASSPTEVGSRSGQPRYRQRDVLTAPSPSDSGNRFGVPPTLSQLLEDSPAR